MQRYVENVFHKGINELFGKPSIALSGAGLDTLEITSDYDADSLDFSGINGKSTSDNILRRNTSKHFSSVLMMKLCELKSPNESKYRDTYYCSHNLIVDNQAGTCKSKFCKRRWCVVCNRIRTADLVSKYMPTLDTWDEKQFVTLTIPNPNKNALPGALSGMYKNFVKMKDNLRKNYSTKLVGVRKLEITYNREMNNYHPHFHLITDTNQGEKIIDQWLRLNPDAKAIAQDYRPANKDSCFELFKYFTKLTSNSSRDKSITAEAIDWIFQNVDGIRTFQTFGFVPHREMTPVEFAESGVLEYIANEEFRWQQSANTWISPEGELLVDYKPTRQTIERTQNIRTWIA